MNIISTDYLTDKMEEELKNEPTCFQSTDGYNWLFNDNKVFSDFSLRFQFDIETEEREKFTIMM